jgi:cobalt/nickel transport system ATP-binding protein
MVAIASVLSMRPEALLLDEPTAFLDDAARDRILRILQQQNIARIVVSHDKDFLERTGRSLESTFTLRLSRDGGQNPPASG